MWEDFLMCVMMLMYGAFFGVMMMAMLNASNGSEKDWLEMDNEFLRRRCKKLRSDLDSLSDLYGRGFRIYNTLVSQLRRNNRSAKVRKWLRHVGMTRESLCLNERVTKILEEFAELDTAVKHGDRVAIADAVADMQYVLETIPLLMGYDGNAVFNAVHESNMTKNPELFKKDGRGKGDGFVEPILNKIVGGDEHAD